MSVIPASPSVSYPTGTKVTLAYQTELEGVNWGGDGAQCVGKTSCELTLDSDKRVELGSGGLPVFLSALALKGIQVRSRVPSQVQFTFSLRDESDHAVVLPGPAIQTRTHIFERPKGATTWQEIDYAETSFFVHTAENFALDVVFVLDFSNSVAQARLTDGRTGTAAILDAFEGTIDDLPGAHRIGVVEFHDRSFRPSVLADLTSDRDTVLRQVEEFISSAYDPGSSRVWDAIDAALDLPTDTDRRVRSIVFLSDGRDTSSTTNAAAVISRAASADVSLYPVGIGDVGDAPTLVSMASQTGGAYYQAPGFDELEQLLEQITNDLKGQYKVSYNTLSTEGANEVRVDVNIGAATGTFVSEQIDFAEIFGADNVGQLLTDPPAFDLANNQTVVFVRASHVPRNVTHLRLRLITDRGVAAAVVSADDGGLLSGWTLEPPDEYGWIVVRSTTPLAFGNFGLLLKLTVEGVEPSEVLALEIDNSGYDGQKPFNDATGPDIAGSCAALQGLVDTFPIEPGLRLRAQ
ncbi:MAG: VWA domain-containing protein, partial [Chloroflexi bacterium]|nr:VWA domain-containing protein [Chloroflexota bacterium]